MLRRVLFLLLLPVVVAGCAAKSEWAPDEMVTRMAYREPGPATLTLVTMVNNRSGSGAHTALMINASQRVIFDPAGSFKHSRIPERNDLIYGVNPEVLNVYRQAHARETYHVMMQTVQVSPEVAERAFQLAQTAGPVPSAMCTSATSAILSKLPGFESFGGHLFPGKLSKKFAQIPGVVTDKLFENDAGDKKEAFGAAAAYVPQTF